MRETEVFIVVSELQHNQKEQAFHRNRQAGPARTFYR
jgi:hypothetical protein